MTTLALSLLCAAPTLAHGAGAPTRIAMADPGERARLEAEIADLHARLQRTTDEISALKRAQRGVRDDYELRRRMAEANDLGQRLTALENQLRRGAAPPTAPAAPEGALEAPAALAARADVLTDQARRLATQAEGMVRAASQLRTRQTLRRRAAVAERDPFAALEGSKRIVVRAASPATLSGPGNGAPGGTKTTTGDGRGSDTSGQAESTAGATPSPTPGNTQAPTQPTPPPTAPGLAGPATPPPGNTPSPMTPTDPNTPVTVNTPGAPGTPGNTPGNTFTPERTNTPPTTSPRSDLPAGTLIDPALRAELSRIQGGAITATSAETLERAAATLTARAKALEAEAQKLRARAATK